MASMRSSTEAAVNLRGRAAPPRLSSSSASRAAPAPPPRRPFAARQAAAREFNACGGCPVFLGALPA
eukprot:4180632-Pyramimonas_sp.AAC.1